jgi:hypothetical protein
MIVDNYSAYQKQKNIESDNFSRTRGVNLFITMTDLRFCQKRPKT